VRQTCRRYASSRARNVATENAKWPVGEHGASLQIARET
jgi:hypothetical protein